MRARLSSISIRVMSRPPATAGGSDLSVGEAEDVAELAGGADADVDAGDHLLGRHAREELVRHLGQQRARQDVVNVARARLDLLAASGYLGDDALVVGEGRAVALGEAAADARKLK